MSAYGTKVVAVLDTQSAFGVTIKTLKDNVDTLTGQMSTLLADAPETLDTLNEIAAAISDDPAFFTTMSSANTTLQANIDTLSTAAATARTALQTALQTAIDANALTSTNAEAALGTRLDSLELDPVTKTYVDAAVTNLIDAAPGVLDTLNEIAAAIGDDANFITTVNSSIAAVQADVDANETASDAAETALSGRLDTLEADPTTAAAVAAVQADVNQNETDADAAIAAVQADVDANEVTAANAVTAAAGVAAAATAAQNTAMLAAVAVVQADVNQNETDADSAIAAVQADVNQNETDADAAIAAVQADVDQNETDADAAIAAVQADVDQNETDADAAIAAVQADVNQNETDADAAIALKADTAGDTFTGDILLKNPSGNAVSLRLSRADHPDMSCEWKISPSYVSSSKECLSILAAGQPVAHFDERQRVSINKTDPDYTLDVAGDGKFSTGLTIGGLTDAANDSAAASAGVAVGQLYRNGSVVMIRVS